MGSFGRLCGEGTAVVPPEPITAPAAAGRAPPGTIRATRAAGRGTREPAGARNGGHGNGPRARGATCEGAGRSRASGPLAMLCRFTRRNAYAASRITWSRSLLQQRLIRRETCIWEMPSSSAMRLCVMSLKNRM